MTLQDMSNIRLIELDEATFQEYKKHLVRDYAAQGASDLACDAPLVRALTISPA